jgi:hypothetical protein
VDGFVTAAAADHGGSISLKEDVAFESKPDPRVGFDRL